MLSVGTNIGSIYAKAAASSAANGMDVAMERLATGKRINAARDDAAGIAISSRMESNIRGLTQAVRNALDAQALLDTAEGGLQEVEAILQRLRELAVQAANDTNSVDDRANLDAEAQSLLAEMDRISKSTTWAGQSLLDGTFANKNFLVGGGATDADVLNVTVSSSTPSDLGLGITAAIAATPQVGGLPQAVTIADGVETTAAGNIISLQKNTGGFVINGIDTADLSGFSVSSAGDVNGDGLADVIVGAYQANPNGNSNAGESYVIFGKADGTAVELSDIRDGQGGFVINGINADDNFGISVSSAGDVNGDGLADVLVGAWMADPNGNNMAGQSYIVFGKTDGTAIELADIMAGQGGFVINGIDQGDLSGISVSSAGDVNGDGLADVIVGASEADRAMALEGESYVIFGKTDGIAVELSDIAAGQGGFVINGIDFYDFSGSSVSGTGDVNGDGLSDLIVGAYQADPGGNRNAGESYVIFGKADGIAVELSDIAAGQGGFVINGIDQGDLSGLSVSGAGDVNGDGLTDIIVGANAADPNGKSRAGESYVIFGKADGIAVELSDIAAGQGGFAINGVDQDDLSGLSVSGAGDVNGDGLADVIVGAYQADPNGISTAGESYVIFGKTDGTAVELADIMAGQGGFVINGIDTADLSGFSVSSAGDVNGDGLADVIVGAYQADPNGNSNAGESYVIFGKADGTAVQLSDISQNPPALSSSATIIVNGKTIAIDLSSYYDGSTNDYYGAAAAVAAAINNDIELQALGYSAVAATVAQVAARTHLAGDVIVSRANTPITRQATSGVPASSAIELTGRTNAQAALAKVDAALETVNSQRAILGALSNRLDHTIANNTNISVNTQASLARIMDADYALESTRLAKHQILQQASVAMLAQANASKQSILQLLEAN